MPTALAIENGRKPGAPVAAALPAHKKVSGKLRDGTKLRDDHNLGRCPGKVCPKKKGLNLCGGVCLSENEDPKATGAGGGRQQGASEVSGS